MYDKNDSHLNNSNNNSRQLFLTSIHKLSNKYIACNQVNFSHGVHIAHRLGDQ